jgi:hypothetical protein
LQKRQDLLVLQTNGSGVLSFGTAGGGKVLQVVTATKVDTQTITGSGDNSPEDFKSIGLSASITPSTTSSRILIIANINGGGEAFILSYGSIFRGTSATTLGNTISNTNLAEPTSSGNRNKSFSGLLAPRTNDGTITQPMTFVDSPSTTSERVYEIGITVWSTQTTYINRAETDTNDGAHGRGVSTLTLIEIGA